MPFCFLNVKKPEGITSFDLIYKLRKRFKIKKIGHSGTLDPMAQGVMQIGIGNASRLIEYLNSDKKYTACMKFGYTSTTCDIEGEITKANTPDFTKSKLMQTLEDFKGEIIQTPPMFSAIKVNGKKLCNIARKNPDIEIEIPSRKIQIYEIKLIDFTSGFDCCSAKIEVSCSKGTYIRTLAQDIALKLNTGAYLTELTRTAIGDFKIENAVDIQNADIQKDAINPLDVLELDRYDLNESEYSFIKNGTAIPFRADFRPKKEYIMLVFNKRLVSIAVLSDNKLVVKKFFN